MLKPDEDTTTINGVSIRGKGFEIADFQKIYEALWQNMQRENLLIANRISWALVITAAFIAAQAFIAGGIINSIKAAPENFVQAASAEWVSFVSWPGPTSNCSKVPEADSVMKRRTNDIYVMQSTACFLMSLMSMAAAYVSYCALGAVTAAIHQLGYLKYYYLRTQVNDKNLFETLMGLPRPFGDPSGHRSGNSASTAFCPVLLILWIILTIVEFMSGMLFMSKAVAV